MGRMAYNVVVSPLVLLVRAPVMLALIGFIRLGEGATRAYDYLNPRLPAFKRER